MSSFGFRWQSSYATLPPSFYTPHQATLAPNPRTIIVNHNLAHTLNLDFNNASDQTLAQLFSGSMTLEDTKPICQAYAGHQFGHLAVLGDGRAYLLGEHQLPNDKKVDVHLKGTGPTAYSRGGDGKASLGPMLREYIISEALHQLNIPTSRSLAVVTTGETIVRQVALPGAVLTRVSDSHIRIGTFEWASFYQTHDELKAIFDYTLERHYPHLVEHSTPALALLKTLSQRYSSLMVHWWRVGFIHGVMNTDNTTLSGESIDFGPCAFMDHYHPDTVFSSIDHQGRYAFGQQPLVAQWNLAKLAEALLPLIHENRQKAIELATPIIQQFNVQFKQQWLDMMRCKLGIVQPTAHDEQLIKKLLMWMQQHHADYTNTFMHLTYQNLEDEPIYQHQSFKTWSSHWQELHPSTTNTQGIMQRTNPTIIPRNHRVEWALDEAINGTTQPFYDLLSLLHHPYQLDASRTDFQHPPKPNERVKATYCGT